MTETSPATASTAHHNDSALPFDALTPEIMRSRNSLKWSRYDGDVIGAWVAEMDLGTAPAVTAVLRRAVENGCLGYMPTGADRAAREAVASFHAQTFGWKVPVGDVSLLPNVLSALEAVIEHHTEPGSAVIVPTPAYMPFLSIPGRHGRECIQVPALHGSGTSGRPDWTLDLDRIEAAMAAGGGLLVLCNPWNPVGRVLEPAELDDVASLSSRYRVPVFADEIHSSLVLDPEAVHTCYGSRSAAEDDLTFTATAVSKGWNIPGLMCAQLIASGGARASWEASAPSAHLADEAAPLGAQAVTAALSPEGLEWNRNVRDYIRGNVELVAEALADIEEVRLTEPAGTYLAWLDCSGLSGLERAEGMAPARFFRREPGVAMNPGAAFGQGYERFCRLNLATSRGIASQIAQRLVGAIRGGRC
ncbi:aminotransferase class I/II-fold pyridoxal phosphate-dependent enzyme [Actinomyces massiliensis]|jgi:possible cystathionine beta-lyase|uniref:MalY/PatB family protein n=1 Tax=Actinomyces massiliensis TaxID=461393 RepID=UPI0028E52E1B|nr:aminotransferase class I/II-fold pyridoxal phosphate-dependent enzyme [Actinomyces massiliensis]